MNSLGRQGSRCLFLKEEHSVGLDLGEGLGGSFPAEVFRLGPLNLVTKLPENYFHQPGMLSPQSTHHEIIGRLHGLGIGIVYSVKVGAICGVISISFNFVNGARAKAS